jgi:hypothetical protein
VVGRSGRRNCCWSSAAQSFLIPSPAGLMVSQFWESCNSSSLNQSSPFLSLHIEYLIRCGPYRRDRIQQFCCVFVAAGTCLRTRCPVTAVPIEYLIRRGPYRKDRIQQFCCVFVAAGTCLRTRCPVTAVPSVSTIPAFRC